MSDNCFKLYLIDGNLQLISHEEAEEIERLNRIAGSRSYEAFLQREEPEEAREIERLHRIFSQRLDESLIPECIEEDTQKVPMVPDLALLLVEIQNMRKRWADEDAALTDFHLYGVLFTDYECDGDVTADA
jgi:hypothetical protein